MATLLLFTLCIDTEKFDHIENFITRAKYELPVEIFYE